MSLSDEATPHQYRRPLQTDDVVVLLEREPLAPAAGARDQVPTLVDTAPSLDTPKRQCSSARDPLKTTTCTEKQRGAKWCSGHNGTCEVSCMWPDLLGAVHEQQTQVLAELRKGHDLHLEVLRRLDQIGYGRAGSKKGTSFCLSAPLQMVKLQEQPVAVKVPMQAQDSAAAPEAPLESQDNYQSESPSVTATSSNAGRYLGSQTVALRRAKEARRASADRKAQQAQIAQEAMVSEADEKVTESHSAQDLEEIRRDRAAKARGAVTRVVQEATISRNVCPSRRYDWMLKESSQRQEGQRLDCMKMLVFHPMFDILSAMLICTSTVIAGVETDHVARYKQPNPDCQLVTEILNYAFALELILRILAYRCTFFTDKEDRSWNYFDTGMVLMGVFEMYSETNGPLSNIRSSSRMMRIVRLLRLLKCMRLGRVVRYAHTFRQIVYSLKSSARTLVWAIAIVFLLIYVFGIVFCQAATDYIQFEELAQAASNETELADRAMSPPAAVKELQANYGTLPLALYSLYKTFTGGQSWGELLLPLVSLHWAFVALFFFFFTVIFFGVLNVVAAIFVDSALQSQQHHKDLLMQDQVLRKNLYRDHLKEVFMAIDDDSSGFITADEMEFFLSDPQLALYLESIDIYPHDARGLFRLLDADASGEISIDEFCEGCMRLKGEAKSFDVHCMIHNGAVLTRRMQRVLDTLEGMAANWPSEENGSREAHGGGSEYRGTEYRGTEYRGTVACQEA